MLLGRSDWRAKNGERLCVVMKDSKLTDLGFCDFRSGTPRNASRKDILIGFSTPFLL